MALLGRWLLKSWLDFDNADFIPLFIVPFKTTAEETDVTTVDALLIFILFGEEILPESLMET